MGKIVTLGEIMLRLSTENNNRFIQSSSFRADYGGGEANVAISLANFGIPTEYVTKLPNNPLAESIFRYLKGNGVQTKNIVIGGERLGTYYLEVGTSIRASSVIYDRKFSSFSTLNFQELDIDNIFKDCDILHLSGITPALSENCNILMELIIKKAKSLGILISFDFNYRSKLWSLQKASKVLTSYLPYIDICFAGSLDAEHIMALGSNKTLLEYYKEIVSKYPNIKYLLSTKRETHSVNENSLTGFIFENGNLLSSNRYKFQIVDRVGGGDAFAAGALCAIYNGLSSQDIVDFATAASVYKHTIRGDANLVSKDEIQHIIKNGISTVSR
ncbi:sugar kinase [uncultured Cetobacterium sp.]|uniref:sugar kinase n=1 Tax=uncultured Cetobacterium sp. TaxID=527638 RepID=UPI00262C22FA|nr:sugar kinase [uncultured Cetobacterium sp.]